MKINNKLENVIVTSNWSWRNTRKEEGRNSQGRVRTKSHLIRVTILITKVRIVSLSIMNNVTEYSLRRIISSWTYSWIYSSFFVLFSSSLSPGIATNKLLIWLWWVLESALYALCRLECRPRLMRLNSSSWLWKQDLINGWISRIMCMGTALHSMRIRLTEI